jgi:hypothetical protein
MTKAETAGLSRRFSFAALCCDLEVMGKHTHIRQNWTCRSGLLTLVIVQGGPSPEY